VSHTVNVDLKEIYWHHDLNDYANTTPNSHAEPDLQDNGIKREAFGKWLSHEGLVPLLKKKKDWESFFVLSPT
jgi:hypothetical protein